VGGMVFEFLYALIFDSADFDRCERDSFFEWR
jgi:hypothetical protein